MQKKQRGGKRPNSGRKPEGQEPLSATIITRLTEEQKCVFREKGGAKWLRTVLSNLNAEEKLMPTPIWMKKVSPLSRVSVPMFEYSVQAGFPSPAENYKETLDFNELLIDNAPATFVLRVSGQSMVDAGLSDEDLIVVDRSRTPKNGDIVVMQIDNEYTVKRFLKKGSGFYLKAENSSGQYPDIFPREGQEWKLFGVVNYVIKAVSGKTVT